MANISQQQLESYLWGAATLLRGTIDAGDYKQFIFPLLFYKRLCDVFDEETQAALKESGGDYEYLIKKFADDSGHTAAEFYTNRTVVHLMTELLQPQPGESIYDPTCGSGGMLLSAIAHLRRQGQEWRNVRLYGQERK